MTRGFGGLSISARVGLGLESVPNESVDELLFTEPGMRPDTTASGSLYGAQDRAVGDKQAVNIS